MPHVTPDSTLPLEKPCSPCAFSTASGMISHDLPRHRGGADRLVIPRVLLSTLCKDGQYFFPFSSHLGPHLTAMTF